MKVSIGDVIGLIGFLVAIQALFSAAYVFYFGRQRKRILTDIEAIKRNSFFLKKLAVCFVDVVTNIRSSMEFQNALINRLIENRSIDERGKEAIYKHFLEDDFIIQKNLQSMIIFTENERRKQSALKQLSEYFGDVETLETLNMLLQYEERQLDDLKVAIETLKRRINTVMYEKRAPNYPI